MSTRERDDDEQVSVTARSWRRADSRRVGVVCRRAHGGLRAQCTLRAARTNPLTALRHQGVASAMISGQSAVSVSPSHTEAAALAGRPHRQSRGWGRHCATMRLTRVR